MAHSNIDYSKEPVMRLALCEQGRLLPQPGRTYTYYVVQGCAACATLAAEQRAAYGQSSPVSTDDDDDQPVDNRPVMMLLAYEDDGSMD